MPVFTEGIKVTGIPAAGNLRPLEMAQQTPINASAFQGDGGASTLRGVQIGQALAEPIAEAAGDFTPLKQAQFKVGAAELKGALADAQFKEKLRPLIESGQMTEAQAAAAVNNYRMQRLGALTGGTIVKPAELTMPQTSNTGSIPDVSPLAQPDPTLTPVSNDTPLNGAAFNLPPKSEDRSAVLDRERQSRLDKSFAANDKVLAPFSTVEKNELINVEAADKKLAEMGRDPASMTNDEKQKALQESSPMAVEGRKIQNEIAEKWISSKDVMEYHTALGSLKGMEEIMKLPPSPANDFTLTYRFMRTIDPQMGVRESQQEAAQNIGSMPTHLRNMITKAIYGESLTPEQRQQIMTAAQAAIKGSRPQYEASHKAAAKRIKLGGGDPSALDELADDQIQSNSGLGGQSQPKEPIAPVGPGAKGTVNGFNFTVRKSR